MPALFEASATVKDPTAVVATPAPSVRDSVAVVPETVTDDKLAPDGAPVRVQGVMPAA